MDKAMHARHEFRAITSSEVESAHAVYHSVFEWLNAKGVRQWLRALPLEEFLDRERKKELFGCFIEKRLAAVVSLALETSPYWPELGRESRWWIKTLAVDRRSRGAGVGSVTMQECETLVWKAGAVDP